MCSSSTSNRKNARPIQTFHLHNLPYMRNKILLLTTLLMTSLQAQDFVHTSQYNMGRMLSTDTVSFAIEYPEYTRLSKTKQHNLQKLGFEAKDHIDIHTTRSVSRGETVYDVSFIPVVKRGSQWYEVKNYVIKTIVKGTKMEASVRKIIHATESMVKTERYAENSVLSKGKWVKIRVGKEGVYQLTDAMLKKAGFSNPAKVKLYGYGGQLLPETFSFTGKNALIDDLNEVPLYRRSGASLFFAEGTTTWVNNTRFKTNTFSSYSYYFLTETDNNSEQPATFQTLAAVENPIPITTVPAHALVQNEAATWYGGGRRFFDNQDLQNGIIYRMSLPGNTSTENTVAYDVSSIPVGATSFFNITCVNDNKSTRAYFDKIGDGTTARGYSGTFKASLGEEARFRVTTSQTGRLHYLYTTYEQQLSVKNTTASFTTKEAGPVVLNIEGANENTRVWRLGNAQEPVSELYGTLENGTYKAEALNGNDRFVIVDITASYNTPEIVGTIENQNLHADKDIDYVIIIPASGKYKQQAEELASIHEKKNGLRIKVVRADQIYNEFSSGTPDATAYRRYMKMLYDKASTSEDLPRYLLLFGPCSYDNRMITNEWKKENPNDYLLAYEKSRTENITGSYSIGTLNDYVTDDYYGFLDDEEGQNILIEKPDLAIGRFPCNDEIEASTLTKNTINYIENENVGAWKNHMWTIGDVGNDNLHMTDAENVGKQVKQSANSGFMLRKIYPDAYEATHEAKGITYPEATSKIVRAMQKGALVFNYNGHGSPDRLSRTFLINKSDFSNNTSKALPLWIFASCEITPYDQALTDIGRNALFNNQGGAIGVICASRSVYANYNCYLNKGVVKYAFAKDNNLKRYSIGEALRRTKMELNTSYSISGGNTIGYDRTENKLKYALLGDPAVCLKYAEQGITIDSINSKKITNSSTIERIAVGEKVTFSGFINANEQATDGDLSFNGILYATIYPPIKNITCKGHDNSNGTNPMQYQDYTQTLFEGSVEVKNGRFTLHTIIPQGISFSSIPSLLSLYAVSNDKKTEYNGQFTGFCIDRSAKTETTDSIGPKLFLYIDTPDFPDSGTATPSSILYATVSDSTGISMMSGNLGHDMELWFDNKVAENIVVNDYFSFDYGAYNKGLLEYPLANLESGTHTATLRIWDVYNNSTTAKLSFKISDSTMSNFDVTISSTTSSSSQRFITTFGETFNNEDGTDVLTEVYSVQGFRVWHNTTHVDKGAKYATFDWDSTNYAGQKLPAGVYLYRSIAGNKKTSSKKLLIK